MEDVTTKPEITYDTLLNWRTAAKLNQQEAAHIFGITSSHYSKIERRLVAVRGKLAMRIAQKTGVPIETLVVAA